MGEKREVSRNFGRHGGPLKGWGRGAWTGRAVGRARATRDRKCETRSTRGARRTAGKRVCVALGRGTDEPVAASLK